MRAEALASKTNTSLQLLDYYLTFIHYFGFSINPNDDLKARYFSIRVKRAAAAVAASGSASPLPATKMATIRAIESDPTGGRQVGVQIGAQIGGQQQDECNSDEIGHKFMSKRKQLATFVGTLGGPLRMCLKFTAITLTTLLTMNHVVVLIDYVYHESKVFMDLMLELRLVITKFSALIFVLAWHRNQAKVRRLIKLVKSTSIYILANEHQHEHQCQWPDSQTGRVNCCQRAHAKPHRIGNETTTRQMNRKILRWWLMCVCVTITHFSLSEAEIRTAQHLWQWLDDYSLHTLNNQTTSISTLFTMASFDNYIYTVHVYGTRLIGASVICIVCSLQIENISCLRRQTLRLLDAGPSQPAPWAPWPSMAAGDWPEPASGAARADNAQQTLGSSQIDRKSFFVLAECNWLQVEHNVSQLEPVGWLSSGLWSARGRLAELMAGRVWARAGSALAATLQRWRPAGLVRHLATPTSAPHATCATLGPAASQRPSACSFGQIASSVMMQSACRVRPTIGGHERAGSGGRPTPKLDAAGRPAWLSAAGSGVGGRAESGGRRQEQQQLAPSAGQQIEANLNKLARKYELVRMVNARIDSCFGHMLLSQYSFLFLMSCIDVVYFSISFSPNTKTKYIIISGMILLWWPYLLLYKFASDIGIASNELLVSVHRLARLALCVQHSAGYSGAAGLGCANLADQFTFVGPWRRQLVHKRADMVVAGAGPTRHRSCGPAWLANHNEHGRQPTARAKIFNKLDHVFKPVHLSIVGIMPVDKFFLLNFAKIVITASVMTIQFISK